MGLLQAQQALVSVRRVQEYAGGGPHLALVFPVGKPGRLMLRTSTRDPSLKVQDRDSECVTGDCGLGQSGTGYRHPGRNQSGLGAITDRSAQNSRDPGLAPKGGISRDHKIGRGFGPVRQASACPSGETILLSPLPIHSPPHLTLSISPPLWPAWPRSYTMPGSQEQWWGLG